MKSRIHTPSLSIRDVGGMTMRVINMDFDMGGRNSGQQTSVIKKHGGGRINYFHWKRELELVGRKGDCLILASGTFPYCFKIGL